jgi:hypothetical protein
MLDPFTGRTQLEAMPRHDPIPNRPRRPQDERVAAPARPPSEHANNWARFRRTMGWMALAAVVAVLLALIYLKSFGDPVPLHMQIATILGVGFSVLVGTGLMALVFLSSRSGHDEDATFGEWNDDGSEPPRRSGE